MRRADKGKARWLAWSLAYAQDAKGTVEERAAYGMERTAAESEHGGTSIGIATYRRARMNWSSWTAEIVATLTARAGS